MWVFSSNASIEFKVLFARIPNKNKRRIRKRDEDFNNAIALPVRRPRQQAAEE